MCIGVIASTKFPSDQRAFAVKDAERIKHPWSFHSPLLALVGIFEAENKGLPVFVFGRTVERIDTSVRFFRKMVDKQQRCVL